MTKSGKWYMIGKSRKREQRREIMRRTIATTLDTVERERERERERESCNLEDERGIRFYALLKLYIRDG